MTRALLVLAVLAPPLIFSAGFRAGVWWAARRMVHELFGGGVL